MSNLDSLREEIRRIDSELLRLTAERMEVAKAIGQRKKEAGVPLRDWDVERQVLDRAERQAEALGVPSTVARAIMRILVAASREEQERLSYSNYRGVAENILIVGGAGKMGRWFADFFADQGHCVTIFDPRSSIAAGEGRAAPAASKRSLSDALNDVTCACIAVSLDATPGVISEIAATGFSGTVFDIASLKSHLKPAIEQSRRAGLAYTSIHPMFGPGTRTLSEQVICVCDCGRHEATAKAAGFFADTAATLVRLSLDEHDQIISYVLGLSHLVNIVITKVLMASGMEYAELNRIGSTTFHSQMSTTATVIREDPNLYYAIQRLNPYSAELREAFLKELTEISNWIRDDDGAAFREMMQAGRRWMTGDDAH